MKCGSRFVVVRPDLNKDGCPVVHGVRAPPLRAACWRHCASGRAGPACRVLETFPFPSYSLVICILYSKGACAWDHKTLHVARKEHGDGTHSQKENSKRSTLKMRQGKTLKRGVSVVVEFKTSFFLWRCFSREYVWSQVPPFFLVFFLKAPRIGRLVKGNVLGVSWVPECPLHSDANFSPRLKESRMSTFGRRAIDPRSTFRPNNGASVKRNTRKYSVFKPQHPIDRIHWRNM